MWNQKIRMLQVQRSFSRWTFERTLNIHPNDNGVEDNVISILSISTVIKEVNSSAVRVSKAFFSGLATATGNEELSEGLQRDNR